jgi:HD superfamily phosphodiesterase
VKKKITERISVAEDHWLEKLKIFLEVLFKDTFLPSHDYSHHLRTWKAAKEILLEIAEFNVQLSDEFVEAVLLASLFHDTGIIETRGIKHGEKGKNIYLKYIAENCQKEPAMHSKIASAIEMHDQKTENLFIPFHWDKIPDLLTLVSIADDMDAMGTIGIYRYAEIYLHRSTPMKSLGMVLLENISTRYNNFSKASSLVPSLLRKTKPRYQEVISFYDNFNQQLLTETDPLKVFYGHIGIVNYIRDFSIVGKIHPVNFPSALENFEVSKYIMNYFIRLKEQLEAE